MAVKESKQRVMISIEKEFHERIKELADKQKRTMSDTIVHTLERYIENPEQPSQSGSKLDEVIQHLERNAEDREKFFEKQEYFDRILTEQQKVIGELMKLVTQNQDTIAHLVKQNEIATKLIDKM